MTMLCNMKNWATHPNTAASLSHTWKATAGSLLYWVPGEGHSVRTMPFKMVNNYNPIVLQSKGTGMKVINCRLFCLMITAYLNPTVWYLQFFKIGYFYIPRREKKMDMHVQDGISESKCWHRDFNVSKIFTHFCFQMPVFRHCSFHLNRDWPAVSLRSLRITGQELRQK